MKKLLLSLLAVAGAWTSAGAQTAIEGYNLVVDNTGKTITLDSKVTLDGYSCYSNNGTDRFTLTSKREVEKQDNVLGHVIKIYKFGQNENAEATTVDMTWSTDVNYYLAVSKVDLTGRCYTWATVECDIDGNNSTTISTKGTSNKDISTSFSPAKEETIKINYQKSADRTGSGDAGYVYIASLKATYNKFHYTLDFTKANTLMSQADALYNSLSAESKASAEGVALLNAKNTTATFKTAHENEAVDVKTGTLRDELTADENAMQAAINAFTCNLADTDEQYTVNGKTVTNVTLTRTIKAGTWNTLCLPFSMDIPAGWTVKELSGVTYTSETNSYDAQFSAVTAIEAGNPYIVQVNEQVDEITRSDAAGFTLAAVPTPVEVSNNGGTLYFGGIFVPMDLAGCYFISGGKFYYAAPDKGNTTKAYRALFTVVGGNSSAQLIYTVDEGALTLIDAPELIDNDAAPVFDLQGRRVNAPVSGQLYVKNGKKFIQK